MHERGSVMGTVLSAEYHEPALSHGVILAEKGRITAYVHPAPPVLKPETFRSTGIAFFDKRYLNVLKECEWESEYSGGIKVGLSQGDEFNLAVLKGPWYHFAYAEDIVSDIKFSERLVNA